MQVQQNAGSSTKVLEVGAYPAGEIDTLKSERVQLRSGAEGEELLDWTILRGRLAISSRIAFSFELSGGALCAVEGEEPAGEAGGVVATPPATVTPAVDIGKGVDRARS